MKRTITVLIILCSAFTGFCQNVDITLLRKVYTPGELASDGFFRFASNSEVYVALGLPVGLAVTGLVNDDRDLIRNAAVILAGEAVASGITLALKYSVGRDRPFDTWPDIVRKSPAGSPSFPSGHTSNAFATATSLSLAYPKWYVITPSYLWAGTVAYSRMHLGVHYPSDVLAGALIGAGSAYLTHKVNQKLNIKKRPRPCNCPR